MREKCSIAVIGTGLIGGSILKALRPKNFNLIAISKSNETIQKAMELNIADRYSTDIQAVESANIVFICTPISKTLEMIDIIRKIVSPDCIISDVASVKGSIIDYINDNEFPTNFIGGHPMAGTENKGVESSIDNLFEGAKWVLTPSKWTDPEDLRELKEVITYMGADVIIANAHEHDKAVAMISHLPLFISQSLFDFVNNNMDEKVRELAMQLASSGFRDATRLAATNPELAIDMLIENKENVRKSLAEYKIFIDKLNDNLDLSKEELLDFIQELSNSRKKMYSSQGKNIYEKTS